MKRVRAVLLMTEFSGLRTRELALQVGIELNAIVVNDLSALQLAFSQPRDLLLSFGTGVIVPSSILRLPDLLALNVHAASPEYPGRDPHHFAVYDSVKQYGATMHYMTQSVDAGLIADVELFDVTPATAPSELLEQANNAGWMLIARFFRSYAERGAPAPMPGQTWGHRKTTRKMFQDLCRIDPGMPKEEMERRLKATAMPGYKNLYADIHGHRFRIEGSSQ
jgi:methionyl-tRNA formyltransferase